MLQKLRNIILVIFLILFNNTNLFATNNKVQLNNVKYHVSNWMSEEWNKTVEFQKNGFNEMKIKSENTKKEINKFFNFKK